MTNNLALFKKDFLDADSWEQRREGVPLDLLDNLTSDELKTAEIELINAAGLRDNWPIIGLGHIKSQLALPKLYDLLVQSEDSMRIFMAHSIFKICEDNKMIDIVLETLPKITNEYELIEVFYYLPNFKNDKITELHHSYRNHHIYLVAYNATQALGLPTKEVVEKFREKR
jgi:hypothetical protein